MNRRRNETVTISSHPLTANDSIFQHKGKTLSKYWSYKSRNEHKGKTVIIHAFIRWPWLSSACEYDAWRLACEKQKKSRAVVLHKEDVKASWTMLHWRVTIKQRYSFDDNIIAVLNHRAMNSYNLVRTVAMHRLGSRNTSLSLSLSLAVQPFGPWPFFQSLNPIHSR
jgi:hypothetical protein